MSTKPTGDLVPLRGRRLTGTREQLRGAVARYQATGQLAEITAPQPVSGRPGLFTVDVRLRHTFTDEPIPVARPVVRRRRRRWPYVVAAVAAALAALAWALYTLITTVAAAVAGAGPLLLGALALAAVLLLATSGGRSACTTIIKVTHKH